ncbi:MAG: phenylalanine--tRNA ligase subunit beta [bacterium]|nr:phenylalanine--tRNA ligase subunit beta [bacterium]
MRIPLSWLVEFVPWSGSPEALADHLTMAGLKVEAVERHGELDGGIRVGRIDAVEAHPHAERLRVCRVDLGEGSPATLVSGAPGLVAGQLVPVALPGAVLPGGGEIGAVTLRGIASEGVLCSEVELGLGDDASGILVLPAEATAGTRVADLPGVRDVVIEIEVTANRGDWLSILGVAREVAAVTGRKLRVPAPRLREGGGAAGEVVAVQIDDATRCARYAARIVRGVRVGRSPFATRLRLLRAGMRPINDVVDATNWIMLERGQPLHAFDLARLQGGRVVVRGARPGETLVTLDEVTRTLGPDDLVIADAENAIAIAGVMGGRDSEVTEATTDLLLESAFFSPAAVRRTSRRLGLPSQAAHRFERRIDPMGVGPALDAVAALIARHAGGSVAPGVVEQAPGLAALAPEPVRLRPRRVAALLGMPLPRGEVTRRLRALGATWQIDGDALFVTPPSWRGDLVIEEDLAEELARLAGYDAVPTTLPQAPIVGASDSPARSAMRRLRRLLVAQGLQEMVTIGFADEATDDRVPGLLGGGLRPIGLCNPLSSEWTRMRRSPLSGLLRVLRANLAQGAAGVAAFELGKGYGVDADGVRHEPRAVSVVLCGSWPACGVERLGATMGFDDLKGALQGVLAGVGALDEDVRWEASGAVAWLHPGKAAAIRIAGGLVGVAGALHPEVAQVLDLPAEVWLAELDFEQVGHYRPRRAGVRPLPRFPAVARDIAVIVDEVFPADTILEEIRALGDPLIASASVFDCYRGAPIPAGKKSLAFTIAYRAADRTLTDDEVNAVHARVRDHLRARCALELRS